VSCLKKYYKTS